jgi:hypothetical protein
MESLLPLQTILPFMEVRDKEYVAFFGPIHPGCGLPSALRRMKVGTEYVCSVYGPSFKKPPLLFMCVLVPLKNHKARLEMTFSPGRPSEEGTYAQAVEHLLKLIEIYTNRLREQQSRENRDVGS